jgi:parallel beta-helix repeat protein
VKASKILFLVFVIMMSLWVVTTQPVKPQSSGTIYIRSDGSVDPPAAPIQRDGNTYTVTDNIFDSIVVEKDNIVVDGAGYTLQGTGDYSSEGIGLTGRSNVTIKNMIIRTFGYGIRVNYGSNNKIIENNITNNQYGVWIYYSSNNNLSKNNIVGNFENHVWLYHSSNNTMSDNYIEEPKDGIIGEIIGFKLLSSSDNNRLSKNIIVGANGGIYLHSSSENSIYENNLTSAWGVRLNASSNNVIQNNTLENVIELSDASDKNTISGNNLTGGGITLNASSHNTISGNIMNRREGTSYIAELGVYGFSLSHFLHAFDTSNLVDGKPVYYLVNRTNLVIDSSTHPQIGYLAVINSFNVTIRDLTLTGGFEPLLIAYTNNSRILGNTIADNYYATRLFRSYYNNISENTIRDNEHGLRLHYSSNNTVHMNNITDNYWYGIGLDSSTNNTISHNIIQRSSYGIILSWFSPHNKFESNTFRDNISDIYYEPSYVPEFPTLTSMLLLFIVLTVATAIYKRRLCLE